MTELHLNPGEHYVRKELHDTYGGQRQYGISTPANRPWIFLFHADTGDQYGYEDGWVDDEIYLYSGEGQRGDMEFTRGNLAILEHEERGRELHLFERVENGVYEYLGEMVCDGYELREARDVDNNWRKAIVFRLKRA